MQTPTLALALSLLPLLACAQDPPPEKPADAKVDYRALGFPPTDRP